MTDLNFTIDNLDELEDQLMMVALEGNSKAEGSVGRVVARAIRHITPGYIAFLKAERDRNAEHGPADAIMALSRVCSLMVGLTASMATKKDDCAEVQKALMELFDKDLTMILSKTIVKDKSHATH